MIRLRERAEASASAEEYGLSWLLGLHRNGVLVESCTYKLSKAMPNRDREHTNKYRVDKLFTKLKKNERERKKEREK